MANPKTEGKKDRRSLLSRTESRGSRKGQKLVNPEIFGSFNSATTAATTASGSSTSSTGSSSDSTSGIPAPKLGSRSSSSRKSNAFNDSPNNKLASPKRGKEADRRAALRRLPSELKVSVNSKSTKLLTETSPRSSPAKAEPISLLDFMERETSLKSQKRNLLDSPVLSHKAVIPTSSSSPRRKFGRASSARALVTKKEKSVRWATDSRTGKVWSSVREFDKLSTRRYADIWWTQDELFERYEEDMHTATMFEEEYSDALREAYDPTRRITTSTKNLDSLLCFDQVAECAEARGLEAEVLPDIHVHVEKHIKAVLKVQTMIKGRDDGSLFLDDDDDDGDSKGDGRQNKGFFNEAELKLIRLQSIKFSRRSSLVAAKMAEFDRLSLE